MRRTKDKYNILDAIVAKAERRDRNWVVRPVKEVVAVNGARVILDNGSWGLCVHRPTRLTLWWSAKALIPRRTCRAIFADLDAIIRTEPDVADYAKPF